MDERVIEKFLQNVEKTKFCWNWNGELSTAGIPVIRIGTKKLGTFQAHSSRRVSLQLAGKDVPIGKHTKPWCGNKLCVNPDHLTCGDGERFWSKVQKLSKANGGCWIWTAHLDKDMYGQFSYIDETGKKINCRATRFLWKLIYNRDLPPSVLVCHKCDNPPCVNPDHLFIGDNAENMTDRDQKGRHVSSPGEKNGQAILTEEQVRRIRAEGKYDTYRAIAARWKVSQGAIIGILSGTNWKHLL